MDVEERLARYLGREPEVDPSAYVADSAELMGSVTVGKEASIWPKCVLRGDINSIVIGAGTNIQDGTIIHLSDDYGVEIGENVTVGHGAILHACIIEDECLIGMRATILDGAVIGRQSIIGANALVPKGMVIPEGSLVMGMPAVVKRVLSEAERKGIRQWAEKYRKVAAAHRVRK